MSRLIQEDWSRLSIIMNVSVVNDTGQMRSEPVIFTVFSIVLVADSHYLYTAHRKSYSYPVPHIGRANSIFSLQALYRNPLWPRSEEDYAFTAFSLVGREPPRRIVIRLFFFC